MRSVFLLRASASPRDKRRTSESMREKRRASAPPRLRVTKADRDRNCDTEPDTDLRTLHPQSMRSVLLLRVPASPREEGLASGSPRLRVKKGSPPRLRVSA